MKHNAYLCLTSTSCCLFFVTQQIAFMVESGQILHGQGGAVLLRLIISQFWLYFASLHILISSLIISKISGYI